MAWRLLVIDGADANQFYPLPEAGIVTVGSNRRADFCLHDLYVARIHCEIKIEAGRFYLTESEGASGTLINGKRIKQQEIKPGDLIRIGNTQLWLESYDPASVAPPKARSKEAAAGPPADPIKQSLARLDELTNQTLAHYEISEVLGRGHYGVIFRALDTKGGHVVALKVLSPEFPKGPAEMQNFVAAIRKVLPLHHPHLVALNNAGKTGPYCWMALEYIEGTSVAQLIEQSGSAKKSHWKSSLRIAIHIGRVLEFLHHRRLPHGNITPAKILVRTSDGVAKLGDLMVSHALEGSALEKAQLEKKLLAELCYLSPEHITPDGVVDKLSDQYSLGAVVYARLTGRPPFQGDSPEDTLHQIVTATPRAPREFHPNIPEVLDAAVMKMLAKDPEERYTIPSVLVAELEQLAEREGVDV